MYIGNRTIEVTENKYGFAQKLVGVEEKVVKKPNLLVWATKESAVLLFRNFVSQSRDFIRRSGQIPLKVNFGRGEGELALMITVSNYSGNQFLRCLKSDFGNYRNFSFIFLTFVKQLLARKLSTQVVSDPKLLPFVSCSLAHLATLRPRASIFSYFSGGNATYWMNFISKRKLLKERIQSFEY